MPTAVATDAAAVAVSTTHKRLDKYKNVECEVTMHVSYCYYYILWKRESIQNVHHCLMFGLEYAFPHRVMLVCAPNSRITERMPWIACPIVVTIYAIPPYEMRHKYLEQALTVQLEHVSEIKPHRFGTFAEGDLTHCSWVYYVWRRTIKNVFIVKRRAAHYRFHYYASKTITRICHSQKSQNNSFNLTEWQEEEFWICIQIAKL